MSAFGPETPTSASYLCLFVERPHLLEAGSSGVTARVLGNSSLGYDDTVKLRYEAEFVLIAFALPRFLLVFAWQTRSEVRHLCFSNTLLWAMRVGFQQTQFSQIRDPTPCGNFESLSEMPLEMTTSKMTLLSRCTLTGVDQFSELYSKCNFFE